MQTLIMLSFKLVFDDASDEEKKTKTNSDSRKLKRATFTRFNMSENMLNLEAYNIMNKSARSSR